MSKMGRRRSGRNANLAKMTNDRPSLIGTIAPGEEWESTAKRGWEAYVGWSLHEEASS